jgi:hypothetical protein
MRRCASGICRAGPPSVQRGARRPSHACSRASQSPARSPPRTHLDLRRIGIGEPDPIPTGQDLPLRPADSQLESITSFRAGTIGRSWPTATIWAYTPAKPTLFGRRSIGRS